ncbi:MAG: mechanosensitive ion channel family protein [Nitrospinaceae bacterium]|nr:mechanosensitive ion channel family protein [Nitrospinaceae bacterium]
MGKKIFQAAFLPVLAIAFFSATLFISNASGDLFLPLWLHQGVLIFLEILVWFSGGWLFNRLLSLLFWDTLIKKISSAPPPLLLVQLSGIAVLILTLSCIAHFVFDEPLTTIIAAAGGLGFVLGFAIQGLILDLFSGLAIQMDRPFKVGDFINCHNRFGETFIGRVEETSWRTTRLWTTERNLIIVPNSYITSTIVTNYSLPESVARFELDYTLDFSVPSDRAIRIFTAALIDSIGPKGPVASPKPKTILTGVNSDGVVYKLRYFLEPKQVSPSKARNTIHANVIHHLVNAGMSHSYAKQDIFLGKMPKRQKSWNNKEDRMDLLSHIALFQDFSSDLLEAITNSFHLKELNPEDILINQGDDGESLFVLVEGLLEVSIQVEGEKRHLTFLRPGSFLGEMALLTGEKRSADVTSSTESLVGELTKESIMSLATENPEVLKKMTAVVAKRRMKNKEIAAASGKDHDKAVQKEEKNLMSRVTNFFFGKNK